MITEGLKNIKLQDYKQKQPITQYLIYQEEWNLQNVFDIVSQENTPNVSSAEEASNHISDDAPFDEKESTNPQ